MGRFGKRDDLVVHQEEPFNAETPAPLLSDTETANDAFYVRNHGTVPDADSGNWRLRVEGLVDRELTLSLATLREAFRERSVTATLQCAGNRRAGLIAHREIRGEAPWGPGATGTATWTGVALADVLALAGPRRDASHVGFEGTDLCPEVRPPEAFGGSIPLDKASRPEVLLAWGMNGEPLSPVHGAPLRVVVPGYIGARSIKWLERIELRSTPWPGHFQHVAYRLVPADGVPGPGVGMPLGLVALNSDVISPHDGATVDAGAVEVRGYASRGASALSTGWMCRWTAGRRGTRPSSSMTLVNGLGGTGALTSNSRRGTMRSSSEPGTPRRPPNPKTRRPCGTPRATSTMPGRGSACEPSRRWRVEDVAGVHRRARPARVAIRRTAPISASTSSHVLYIASDARTVPSCPNRRTIGWAQ